LSLQWNFLVLVFLELKNGFKVEISAILYLYRVEVHLSRLIKSSLAAFSSLKNPHSADATFSL
jgi:hypothetical protein